MYKNCYKNPQPYKAASINKIERTWDPKMSPFWVTGIQNEYGDVHFEDSFENNTMSDNWTQQPAPRDNRQASFENPNSIYFPDNALHSYRAKPVAIGELRNRGAYYGVKQRPSQNCGIDKKVEADEGLYVCRLQ